MVGEKIFMPIYQYKCTECEDLLEVQQSFTEDSLTELEGCKINADGKHSLKKVFSSVGIAFKGDGFYKNDTRSSSVKSDPKTPAVKSTESKSETKKSSESTSKDSSASKPKAETS